MQVLLFSSSLGHNSALTEGTLVPWGGTYLGIEVSLPEYTTQFAFSTSHLTRRTLTHWILESITLWGVASDTSHTPHNTSHFRSYCWEGRFVTCPLARMPFLPIPSVRCCEVYVRCQWWHFTIVNCYISVNCSDFVRCEVEKVNSHSWASSPVPPSPHP